LGVWRCGVRECVLCYLGRKGRNTYRGHYGYRAPRAKKAWVDMSVIRRRDRRPAVEDLAALQDGGVFGRTYPGLWEMLSAERNEDGSKRLTSTLTLFVDDGGVKAVLNDRDQALTGWACGSSVEAVLESLERGLQADTIEWRVPAGGKRKKK